MEKNPNTIKELSEKLEVLLIEYEQGLGIKNTNPQIPAEKYLTISQEEIAKMTAEMCGEASVILAQYAFYLQRSLNIEIGRVGWATAQIERTIAPVMKNYNASSAPERRMLAIKDNEYAMSAERLRMFAQTRVDRINYLSSKIDALSYRFADLQQTKRGKQ